MTDIITTEHCFNFHDATHEDGTNRYVFNYPEIWYVNQTIKDMAMGIRSIILKPEPIYVSFTNVFAMGISPFVVATLQKLTTIPIINSFKFLSNQMMLDFNCNVDDKIDILSFVNWANQKYKDDYDHFKDIVMNYYEGNSVLDLSKYSIYWNYDKDGNLSLRSNQYSNIAVALDYTSDAQITFKCSAFNEGFHRLVGLDWSNSDKNINTYIANMAYYLVQILLGDNATDKKAKEKLAKVIQDANDNGIEFSNVQIKSDPILTQTVDGKTIPLYWYVLFDSITFSNVWSRKDVLLTSSIVEMDRRGYLGFSSNWSNSSQAIYPQPKMFDVNNTESKFWVDLYDSYTQKSIQMLGGNLLLIEAIVCQKPKRTFNRT